MKELLDYRDPLGFIGHRDDHGALEFGDGLQRLSMEALFRFLLAYKSDGMNFAHIFIAPYIYLYLLVFVDGEPTRHWDRNQWYGRPGTCSRDQLRPTFCALYAMGCFSELRYLWWKLLCRGLFAWNTKHIGQWDARSKIPDFVGFAPMHTLLRAAIKAGHFYLYPLLIITEFLLLMNALFRIIMGYIDSDDSSNDLNMTCDLLAIKTIGPQTPLSWFAHELYFGLMPIAKVPDKTVRVSHIGVISRFQNYFAGPKNPPLDVLAAEAILKLS